jgi:hypothetical protein
MNTRLTTCLDTVMIAGALALGAAPAIAQSGGTANEGPIVTTHERFRDAVRSIARTSPLWRTALDSVAARGRTILLLTPDEVIVSDSPAGVPAEGFDESTLAEVSPVLGSDGSVDVVLVVVNYGLLASEHRRLGLSESSLEADLARILIHEVYGHAIPYLIAGASSARCADPLPGEAADRSCSIRRENAVRAEARLGHRSDYALASLDVGARLASSGRTSSR